MRRSKLVKGNNWIIERVFNKQGTQTGFYFKGKKRKSSTKRKGSKKRKVRSRSK